MKQTFIYIKKKTYLTLFACNSGDTVQYLLGELRVSKNSQNTNKAFFSFLTHRTLSLI